MNVAGIEQVPLELSFWAAKSATSSWRGRRPGRSVPRPQRRSSSARSKCRNVATKSTGEPSKLKVYVSLTKEIFSAERRPRRSARCTLPSTPQVIGLTKPSGGGGE